MPSVFDISPVSDTVKLDDQGNGETTFTVANHADRPRRGRAYVVADPPVDKSWISIEDPEREFPVEGVKQIQQFTVKLKVPPDKPIKGSFKIAVASLRLPERSDEHFTVGPPVGFEVKAVEPTPAKPFPWWILVVGVVVLLLVGGVVTYVLWPSSGVTVPDVVKQSRADAERTLKDEGLEVGKVNVTTSAEKPGIVLSTTPPAGAKVEEGSAVDLVVSSSFVKVPKVVGMPVRDAAKVISDAVLVPKIVTTGSGAPGVVLDQNPRPGVDIALKDVVELIVAQSMVPNVVGQQLANAMQMLREMGIRIGTIRVIDASGNVVSTDVFRGSRGGVVSLRFATIVRQAPPAGTPAQAQQSIDVIVRPPQ